MAQVRFFTNRTGQRIAYADEGAGPLVVLPPWWVSHLERDADSSGYVRFFERLARRFRVVRFDRVGVGLSDRTPREVALETEVDDLDALIETLGSTRVHLLAVSCGGPIALAWAARNPDRIGKIALYASYVRGADLSPRDLQASLIGLVRAHWGLGSTTLADLFFPNDPDAQRRFKALQKVGADGQTAARLLALTFALDASPSLDRIQAEVLVAHRRGDRVIPYEHGRQLAASLPHATLVTLDGSAHMPWEGDGDAVVDAVEAFFGGRPRVKHDDAPEMRRRGELWSLRFEGREVLVAHGKGLVDLAKLLARPGEELHVLDLTGAHASERRDEGRSELTFDRAALESYMRRLGELDAARRDAQRRGDTARAQKIEAEREALTGHIAAGRGLRGRPRKLNDPVERARKAVTARLRDAMKRIQDVHPELGAHLEKCVTTGTHCVYRGARWIVTPPPI